jgi:excisionase family DNA binding protein
MKTKENEIVFISMTMNDFQATIIACVREVLQSVSVEKNEKDELLTVTEAAVFLNLCNQTIYGLVSSRKIPFSKKGKRLYFSKKQLTEWVHDERK